MNEVLITKYEGDASSFVRETERTIGSSKKLARQLDLTDEKLKRRQSRISNVRQGRFFEGLRNKTKATLNRVEGPGIQDFSNLGKAVIGSLVGVATAASVAGVNAMRQAADFDALVKSLETVEGQGDRTKTVLKELRELAKLPGIELNDTIQSFVNLRRSNLGGDFAKSLIRELGNANATGGGGQAEFSQAMRAITQIANKPFLQGDELIQLMEAGIPAYQLIKDIFGTTDTEELKRQGIDSRKVLEGLVQAMSKMPRVANSAKNDFENLAAAVSQASISAGAALNRAFLPKIREATAALDAMSESGAITRAFEDIAEMLGGSTGVSPMEDLLFGILVEAKTIAAGIQNLIANAEGAKEGIEGIWDWATTPRGGENKEQWEKNKANAEGAAPTLGQLRQKFIDEMEGEKRRLEANRKRKAEDDAKAGTKPISETEAADQIISPMVETARNTARIAQLQEKQNQITESIIGGTTRPNLTPVELGGLRSGGRRTIPNLIQLLTTAVYQENHNAAMGVQLDMARRGQFKGAR